MKIEQIRLKNYKVFKDIKMSNIPKLCVIVGANGTGKTTLFDVFGFLKDCLTYNVSRAIQTRGGFKELVSRQSSNEIEIEIKFRMKILNKERLVTYFLSISESKGKPVVNKEILKYKRGQHGSPFHYLDFSEGTGKAVINEEDFDEPSKKLYREEQNIDSATLAIKGLGQFKKFKAANAFRNLIENWHVSDFHINAARGSKDIAEYAEHLSVSGDNLQLVANEIYHQHRNIFDIIVNIMKRRIPGIGDIIPEPTQDGRLLLKFSDGSFKDPFIDKYVSDGTLKMFAYLILLHDPSPHPLLCVEEPENQLYPKLLWELAEEFRLYSLKGGQVFVSTHSPDFLNAMKLNEVFWLEKQGGYSDIFRVSENAQIKKYMEEGDQLGYLWKQGFFGEIEPK